MPLCVPMYVQGTSFKISLERFFHISSIIDVICTSGLKHGGSGGGKQNYSSGWQFKAEPIGHFEMALGLFYRTKIRGKLLRGN